MTPKQNPLKLNSLQLKTLTLLQELARHPESGTRLPQTGDVVISHLPHPHGDHFHLGGALVMAKDATGLHNESGWKALERKGLAAISFPDAIVLNQAGQTYDTGLRDVILHGSDH